MQMIYINNEIRVAICQFTYENTRMFQCFYNIINAKLSQ